MLRHVNAPLRVLTRRSLSQIRAASTTTIPSASTSRDARSSSSKRKPKPAEDAKNSAASPKRPLLKAHQLSARLNKLCEERKLDEAVDILKNMPRDAQNTAVWNGVILQAGRMGRTNLAYDLFIDMKRRGFKPDRRTYSTILGAFGRVTDWAERTKLLERADSLYEEQLGYMQAVKMANPTSPELSVIPTNAYLSILSKSKQWQRMFDIYNSLCGEGSLLSPDEVTYSILLTSFGVRSISTRGDDPAAMEARARAASDARFIWRQMHKQIEQGAEITIDAYLVDAMVKALALGRPADQLVAFDILREYAGLAKPGETAPPATVELTKILLFDALWLCNATKKYRLCVHWVQQLMKSNPSILDSGHINHALSAYGSQGAMGSISEAPHALQMLEWMIEQETSGARDERIRPVLATYTLVLTVCWRGKDWESALRTFELMSGFRREDFADGASRDPQPVARSKGRNLVPDAAALAGLVRTAVASEDKTSMRQCARILRRLGLGRYLGEDAGGNPNPNPNPSQKQNQSIRETRQAAHFKPDTRFYAHKTAAAVIELVDEILPQKKTGTGEGEGEGAKLTEEEKGWDGMRKDAKAFLVAQRHHRPHGTPQLEEQPLGSESGLAAMDDHVQWARLSRESRSPKGRNS